MIFITVDRHTYNLGQLVKYENRTGQRGVGATDSVTDPEPIFGEFRYVALTFSDGSTVELSGPQTEAFLSYLGRRSTNLDLDKVEEATVGHVVVHDTEEGGDIILPPPESESDEVPPIRTPLPDTANPLPPGL